MPRCRPPSSGRSRVPEGEPLHHGGAAVEEHPAAELDELATGDHEVAGVGELVPPPTKGEAGAGEGRGLALDAFEGEALEHRVDPLAVPERHDAAGREAERGRLEIVTSGPPVQKKSIRSFGTPGRVAVHGAGLGHGVGDARVRVIGGVDCLTARKGAGQIDSGVRVICAVPAIDGGAATGARALPELPRSEG